MGKEKEQEKEIEGMEQREDEEEEVREARFTPEDVRGTRASASFPEYI